MAIYATGDTHGVHGLINVLRSRPARLAEMTKDDYLVICGDFGCVWDPILPDGREPGYERHALDDVDYKGPTVLFVPGNHENYDRLTGLTEPDYLDAWPCAELSDTAREKLLSGYPRMPWHGGTVRAIRPSIMMLEPGEFEIDGRRVLAFGGAPSHDVQGGLPDPRDYGSEAELHAACLKIAATQEPFRVRHVSWWPQEVPSRETMESVLDVARGKSYDLVFTHDLPMEAKKALGYDDADPVCLFLQELFDAIRFKAWYAGHYHMDRDLPGGIRVMYKDFRSV